MTVRHAYAKQPAHPIAITLHGTADKSVRKAVTVYDGSMGQIDTTFSIPETNDVVSLSLQKGAAVTNLQLAALRAYWVFQYLQNGLADIPVTYILSAKEYKRYNELKRSCVINIEQLPEIQTSDGSLP
ncbi:hypothetical protein [Oleidesulfovibrio sp.]|uniref:hypothetical protein n=1 Tax=Oleidesulfovibrio sp. TaxID=2909707 RepID=UPI003A8475D0